MKTIKLSFIALFTLLISILLLKYAVISYNYITIDFQPVGSKDIVNFGLTFGIQTFILLASSLGILIISIVAGKSAYKAYLDSLIKSKDNQLFRHLNKLKYEDLINKLKSTNSTVLKEEYIREYIKNKEGKNFMLQQWLEALKTKYKASKVVDNTPIMYTKVYKD